MLYEFMCMKCSGIQSHMFPANDYDKFVMEDGRLKRKKCENCKTITLYRLMSIPDVMGGSRGYMSMERFWSKNKDERRRKEDAVAAKMAARHYDRVTSRINKQTERSGRDKRNEGYGEGQGEQRLKSD